jgi:chromate transporter
MDIILSDAQPDVPVHSSPWALFGIFLRLGLTCFGGPTAHIGYFRDEFVQRRRWLDEQTYSDIVALCQFLPGPASSQVGIAIGLMRGVVPGSLAAWCGFTLPSTVLMVAFAYGHTHLGHAGSVQLLHGLKLAAVAVVAHAVWSMGRTLCPDRSRATIAVAATVLITVLGAATGQIVAIILAAVAGAMLLSASTDMPAAPAGMPGTKRGVVVCITAFILLLLGLPLAAGFAHVYWLDLFSSFYRVGSLVFGGAHVVLPLLQAVVVPRGWVSINEFLAGYGAAQAIPGPLTTFAAFLGESVEACRRDRRARRSLRSPFSCHPFCSLVPRYRCGGSSGRMRRCAGRWLVSTRQSLVSCLQRFMTRYGQARCMTPLISASLSSHFCFSRGGVFRPGRSSSSLRLSHGFLRSVPDAYR